MTREIKNFSQCLLYVALVSLLCACATPVPSSCRVLDPDFATGIYRGACKNGWAEGYAQIEGENSYQGDFVAGKKHGRGVKSMSNGDRYSGEFRGDYRQGKGVYEWGKNSYWAGDRYEGEYQRDLRHGWGVFQWSNGDRYEGTWHNDKRKGASVMEQRRAQSRALRGQP